MDESTKWGISSLDLRKNESNGMTYRHTHAASSPPILVSTANAGDV